MDVDDASQVAEDISVLRKRKWSPSKLVADPPQDLPFRQPLDIGFEPAFPDDESIASATKRIRLRRSLETGSIQATDYQYPFARGNFETKLPAEILQYILSFLDPLSLGRAICVSRLFRALLDPNKPLPIASQDARHMSLQPQESLWSAARKQWCPNMPRPMSDMNEYSSIKLALGKNCQLCGMPPRKSTSQEASPWTRGPGTDSVRIIWPFKIRSCLRCLAPRMVKDIEVWLSSASFIIPGLAFALFTSSFHLVPATVARQTNLPQDINLSKYFYREHVEILKNLAGEAQSLGSAALEEWLKGLDGLREQANGDAARFEQWENAGGRSSTLAMLVNSNNQESHKFSDRSTADYSPLPAYSRASSTVFEISRELSSPFRQNKPYSLGSLPHMPLQPIGLAPGQEISNVFVRPASDSASVNSQKGRTKPPKSVRDVTKIRGERERDIQRRCMLLDPPIYPEVLEDLPAFDAALQISKPLDDVDWETLKERLLLQLRDQQIKNDTIDSIVEAPIPGEYNPQKWTPEMLSVNAKKPIREKLRDYAEDYIRHKWGFGTVVDYASAPQFAADVLQHVRSRFYEIQLEERRLLNPPETKSESDDEFLTLEHMKWVFEQNVKPRTEPIRKELFFCNLCNLNGAKHFAFDSVVQHYASKHTNELSRGQQTVYWKSKWPDQPIFNPRPERTTASHAAMSISETLPSEVFPLPLPPGSAYNVRIPSAGRRSPGTLSLTSTQTGTLPIQSPIQRVNFKPGPPGVGMYHAQRDDLTSFIIQAWREIEEIGDLTLTVQVYLLVHRAIRLFKQIYANEPHLSLFSDCIDNKPDLKTIRDLGSLRCRYCLLSANKTFPPQVSAFHSFRLADLLHHFRDLHVEQRQTGTRITWKHDMVELPPSGMLREFASRTDITENMRDLLKDALVTALSDGDPIHSVRAPDDLISAKHTIRNGGRPHNRPLEDISGYAKAPAAHYLKDSGLYPGSTVPVTYNEPFSTSIIQEPLLPHSTSIFNQNYHLEMSHRADTVPGQHHSHYYQPYFPTSSSYLGTNNNSNQKYIKVGSGEVLTQHLVGAETTDPASTVHSTPMSRGGTLRPGTTIQLERDRPASTSAQIAANDFLRALDNMADIEMKQDSGQETESRRPSRPQSPQRNLLSSSQPPHSEHDEANQTARRTSGMSTDTANVSKVEELQRLHVIRPHPSQRPSFDRTRQDLSPELVTMSGGRVIEYDHRGIPIESEIRYVELSPQRTQPSHIIDRHGRLVELAHPEFVPAGNIKYRDNPPYTSSFPEEARYLGNGRERIEYIQAPPDAYYGTSGRYYVERPVAREYIELEDRYDRVPSQVYSVYEERPVPREEPSRSPTGQSNQTEKRIYERYNPTEYEIRHSRR